MVKIVDKEFFMRGKRGFIFIGFVNGRRVAIKEKNPDSKALNRIEFEAGWLKRLNVHGIGPKFVSFDGVSLVYEFVEGVFIEDFVLNNFKKKILKVLVSVFEQMFVLDQLGVNKEEMHHPHKHILVQDDCSIVLIDFERANSSERPRNVTQFCQFVTSSNFGSLLFEKGFSIDKLTMRVLAKDYKGNPSRDNFRRIMKELK
jgi:predicted Ser/Thr protein kinase